MQTHNVKRTTSQKTKKRVGRGGTRGKTSGRGMKGQKARAGSRKRPEMRDTIKKIPKLRGHGINRATSYNDSAIKAIPINIAFLEQKFTDGESVNPSVLLKKKLVRRQGGKAPRIKILGQGDITKKLVISKCEVSKSAKEKIEKAGGKVE